RAHASRRGPVGPWSVVKICRVGDGKHVLGVLLVIGARSSRKADGWFLWARFSSRLFFGGIRLRRFRKIGFGDPAGDQPRLHDHGLGILARDFDAVEIARVLDGFAVLALGPADQIVGGA